MIPYAFDESNEERRKRVYLNVIKTSEKLNRRLKQAINDINGNYSLSGKQKKECIDKILNGIVNQGTALK